MLLITISLGSRWRMKERSLENRLLQLAVICAGIACGLDLLLFIVDGRPGSLIRAVSYIGNSWLFLSNIFISVIWIEFFDRRLHIGLSRAHRAALYAVVAVGAVIVAVNLFCPIVFTVSAANEYARGALYWFYTAAALLIMADSVVIYFRARRQGGVLKFFPIWIYIAPILAGVLLQAFFYGISVIWPCITIALAGVIVSVQNEVIYRDKLTGLYNRSYLDYLRQTVLSRREAVITGIMLDINDFKSINDRCGHSEGDDALRATAEVLMKTVGSLGTVVRYAGDEFVVLINTQDEAVINACMDEMRKQLDAYNESAGKPYSISVSMGCHKFDPYSQTVNEFINEIDRNMYEDKKKYYEVHAEADRRRLQPRETGVTL